MSVTTAFIAGCNSGFQLRSSWIFNHRPGEPVSGPTKHHLSFVHGPKLPITHGLTADFRFIHESTGGLAPRAGLAAQPLHQAGVAVGLIPPPDTLALAVAPHISSAACTCVSSPSVTPAMIVTRARSFRLIVNVSISLAGCFPGCLVGS